MTAHGKQASGLAALPPNEGFKLLDELADVFAQHLDSGRIYELLPKRYVDRQVAAHLHMGIRPSHTNRDPQYFCAVFQGLSDGRFALARDLQVHAQELQVLDYVVRDCEYRRKDESVFVGVREVDQGGQGSSLRFRTLIRLYELDCIEKGGAQTGRSCLPARECPTLRLSRPDRELVLLRYLPATCDDHLTEQMIERGPHVLNRISEDQPNGDQRLIPQISPKDVLRALIFEFSPSFVSIRLNESSDFAFECFEMFVCPVELPPDAF